MPSKGLPPFAALRAFEAVGRLGGIRKAAAALSLHHAVVSRHIASLEQWIGQPLITRDRRLKLLTEVGQRYHERVHQAFAELAAATEEAKGEGGRRRLRIWTNGGFASKWLSRRISEFEALQGSLEIELRPSDRAPDLLNGEAEVDVRYFGDSYSPDPGGRSLRHVELVRPHIMAVAAPGLAARLEPLGSAADLLRQTLLHEEDDAQWRAWLAVRGHQVAGEIAGPRLWHAHLAIAAAVEGRGIALASAYLVSDELRSGSLVVLPDPDAPAPEVPLGGYVLSTRADRFDTLLLRRFRRWLGDALSVT
jgi:DNA-binding transcriptional LysR family regulator